jgi:transposase
MAFVVEHTIGNTTYVYKSVGYWDRDKKQARHRRVCLGKRDPKTGELIPSKLFRPPRACRDYGAYYVLSAIAEGIGLTALLQEVFPELWRRLLTCAFFEVSEKRPLYLCEAWSESTQTETREILSSQRISELLKEIGNQEHKRLEFFRSWAKHRAEQEYIAFDITSISSYSQLIEAVEYGYNRDGEDLPQINLGMLFGQTSLLPVFYTVYQGSIRDVATLHNMMAFAEHLDLRQVRYVMDKGFFSARNVAEMLEKRLQFHLSVPFTTSLARQLVDDFETEIARPPHSFLINGDILYGLRSKTAVEGRAVMAHLIFDERKRLDGKERFLKQLIEVETWIRDGRDMEDHLQMRRLKKYLRISRSGKRLLIRRDEKKIAEALRHKGYLIILSNCTRDPQDAVQLYRAKDAVERAFDNMKNELDVKRLRVHSDDAMRGRLFVAFLSLILYSWIDKRMRDKGLYATYTQEQLFRELKRIKVVELSEERTLLTELSRKQKDILKALGIPLPQQTLS